MKLKFRGFSLIELMIVIAIIGILASIAVPSYRNYIMKARVAELLDVGSALKNAVNDYIQGTAATTLDCTNIQYNVPLATANVATAAITKAAAAANGCQINVTGTATSNATKITITPTLQADGSITWVCSSGKSQFAPSNCQ